ncbi:hypothetical protein CTI12_AA336220 [Artemisia annua]|uniref:Uncharacterized protein n=1 Tax=Artemisia annua TaxID=35608 RepID=A0A2U1MVM6_ARTAN|nr:hypothetical protein CTI12_AA336220 [Artemisia annua]
MKSEEHDDDADILAASEFANAQKFIIISGLQKDYDTMDGTKEWVQKMSRSRVVIAKASVKSPNILLLD